MAKIIIHKGGTAEREVDISVQNCIPDLWHAAQNCNDPQQKEQILECWYLAHAMRNHILGE